MRFMSNGYPAGWFDEVDYNSTRAVGDKSEVDQQIDAAIAALKQRTGKSQVDVVAHSLGTSVMYDYLTNGAMAAQRRANVAHYINVDGQDQNPGVPTLAVWAGRGTPGRQHGRRAERHDPQPDPRPDLHLGPVVRRVLQVPDRPPAGAATSSGRTDRYRSPGRRSTSPRTAGRRARPFRSGRSTTTGGGPAPRRSRHCRSPTARRGAAPGGRSRSRRPRATSSRSCGRRCRRSTSTTSRS